MLRRLGLRDRDMGGTEVPHRRRFGSLLPLVVTAVLFAALGFSTPMAVRAANPTPVAQWTFDEGSGSTAHDSIGNLDGSLSSGATWITSGAPQGSGAIGFDGTANGLVTIANDAVLEPTGDFSLALWVRGSGTYHLTQHAIVQKGRYSCNEWGSWAIDQLGYSAVTSAYVVGGGTPWTNAQPFGGSVWDGEWHRVVTVFEASGRLQVWVDGYYEIANFGDPWSIEYGPSGRLDDALVLGGTGGDCPDRQPFQGAIDQLQLYDEALSQAQILAMMPVHSTTTIASAVQDGRPDPALSVYNDTLIRLRSTTTPTPGVTGDTTFYLSRDGGPEEVVGTESYVPSSGAATFLDKPPGSLQPGDYTLRTVWHGNSNWLGSSSDSVTFSVIRRPVSMSLTANPTEEVPGGSTTLKARVTILDPRDGTIPSDIYAIPGSVEFYETTGGSNTLLGSAPMSFVIQPHANDAQLTISGLTSGSHTYEARWEGNDTIDPSTATAAVNIGPQESSTALTVAPNPVLTTAHATASVTILTSRKGLDPGPALPAPSGTLTLKNSSTGSVLGSAIVNGAGPYSITLPTFPVGSVGLRAEYSGDSNFDPSVSAVATLSVQNDIVEVTDLGLSYSTFYPVKDGYRDTVSIKGNRQEPASVIVRIYNSTNHIVKGFSLPTAYGQYSLVWNGRNSSGTILAAGAYRVVQTLTDEAGMKLVVTKSVTLSKKRLYYYTTTLTKLGKSVSSVGHLNGGKVTTYSDGSIRLYGGMGWAGAGWQFALPSAAVYKSIAIGVYGYTGAPPGQMGAQNFTYCAYSSTWNTACFDRWTSLKTSKGWASRSISTTANRYKRAVRVAVSQTYGSSRVYKVRVVVTYGLLK